MELSIRVLSEFNGLYKNSILFSFLPLMHRITAQEVRKTTTTYLLRPQTLYIIVIHEVLDEYGVRRGFWVHCMVKFYSLGNRDRILA